MYTSHLIPFLPGGLVGKTLARIIQYNSQELYLVDCFSIWTNYPDINVQEASFSHLKHEAHFCARLYLGKEG